MVHHGKGGNILFSTLLEPHWNVILQAGSTMIVYWWTGLDRNRGKRTSRSQTHSLSTCFIHLQQFSSAEVSLYSWCRSCLCLCLLSGGLGGEGGAASREGGGGGGGDTGTNGSNEHAWFTSANWEGQRGLGWLVTHWPLDPLGCTNRNNATINTIFRMLCMSISLIDRTFFYWHLKKDNFQGLC